MPWHFRGVIPQRTSAFQGLPKRGSRSNHLFGIVHPIKGQRCRTKGLGRELIRLIP